jgi:hypothetical protein
MKIAYIAHPIGGDVKANLKRIEEIGRKINIEEPNVVPFAPYFFDCHAMDDGVPEERLRGIKNARALFRKGFIDEVRLYGDRISKGMMDEIELAVLMDIEVIPMTQEVQLQFFEVFGKKIQQRFKHNIENRDSYNPKAFYALGKKQRSILNKMFIDDYFILITTDINISETSISLVDDYGNHDRDLTIDDFERILKRGVLLNADVSKSLQLKQEKYWFNERYVDLFLECHK